MNNAYRWFFRLTLADNMHRFTTYGKEWQQELRKKLTYQKEENSIWKTLSGKFFTTYKLC